MKKITVICGNAKRKLLVGAGTVALINASCALPVLAADASAAPNSAVVDAMTKTSNEMLSTGTAILPVALAVVGLALVITFGIKLFKKVANKG